MKSLLLCILLVLLIQLPRIQGDSNFRWYCDLQKEPVVELRWDEQEKAYAVWEDSTNEQHRKLERTISNELIQLEQDELFPVSFLRGDDGGEVVVLEQEDALQGFSRQMREGKGTESMNLPPSSLPQVREQRTGTSKPNILVRRCPCWNPIGLQREDFFCPLPRTHCGLAAGWSSLNNPSPTGPSVVYDDPGCLDIKRQRSFARNVWPIVTVW